MTENKKFFPKNRKGFLLGEETLKIVIAVICIVFLIYLLVAVYFNVTGEQKVKEADASMKSLLVPEIERINDGGAYNSQGILIPNPSDWSIFSFVGEEKKPNSCMGENCICICENAFPDLFDWQIKRCDKKGVCNSIVNLAKFEKIKIGKTGVQISIQKINEQIQVQKI